MSSALPAGPKSAYAILASGLLDAVPAGALSAVLGSAVPKERAGQLMRMDRLCGLAVSAADQLLSSAPSLLDRGAWPAERIGVLVGSSRGCHKTDEEYFRSYIDGQPSPRLFAYTLPSSPVGEISILHGLMGPGLAIVSGRCAGLEALDEAQQLLAAEQADACLVCAAEVAQPALQSETLLDGAAALWVVPAQKAQAAAGGYLSEVSTSFSAQGSGSALMQALAGLPDMGAAQLVLCDDLTASLLPPQLRERSIIVAVASFGAVAPFMLLQQVPLDVQHALVACVDDSGQAACVLWSRLAG